MITPDRKAKVSLNTINFFFYGGIACIFPFLSVHLRSIGLTIWHIVWLNVGSGFICILLPLIVGTIAERRGSSPNRYLYKTCFAACLFLATLCYGALLMVPKVTREHTVPEADFDCSSPLNAVVKLEKCANYESCIDVALAWSRKARLRLTQCQFKYKEDKGFRISEPDTAGPLQVCFRTTGNTTNHCLVYDPLTQASPSVDFISDMRTWIYTEYQNVSIDELSYSKTLLNPVPKLNVCSFVPATSGTVIKLYRKKHDAVTCQRSLSKDVVGIKCRLTIKRDDGKQVPCYKVKGDLYVTFWSAVGLRAAADSFLICALCLLEGITLRTIPNGPYDRGAYGRSRLSALLALIVFPPTVGLVLDFFSASMHAWYYPPAYCMFIACEILACILIYALPLPVGGNTFRYVISQDLRSRNYDLAVHEDHSDRISYENVAIAAVSSFAGAAWSVSQVFTPLLYQDKDYSSIFLGIGDCISFLVALPFLAVSKLLIQNLGDTTLISVGFMFHAIHLAGISFVSDFQHWWWAVPFEAMKAFSLPLMWVALAAAVQHRNCKGKRIGMHYVLVMSFFGVGRVLGCSAGGFLAETYSMSLFYRVMSIFSLCMGLFYAFLQICIMKPRERRIRAARCAMERESISGSSLMLIERPPVNGLISPRGRT